MSPVPHADPCSPPSGQRDADRARPDPAATGRWRFSIVTDRSPQMILRVIGLFAQRDLIPETIRTNRHRGTISLIVEQDDLHDRQAVLIAEKIRAIVGTCSASVSPASDAHRPTSRSDATAGDRLA